MFAIGTELQKERYGDHMQTNEEYWYEFMQDHNSQLGNSSLIRRFVSEAKNTVAYCLECISFPIHLNGSADCTL